MAALARIAVIGCGSHAVQNLYPSFRLSVLNPPETGAAIGELAEGGEIGELAACCDLDEARARRAARDFGIARFYTDHRTLLERERPDGVVVAMHPRLQPAVARDCLEAGAHVFLEKPPAETLPDCVAIRDAAEAAGRQVMVGFMKRFSEPYRRAREIIGAKAFGGVSSYAARFTFGVYPPRAVYDFLNGFACHHLDLARWLAGEVAWVAATRTSRADGDPGIWEPTALELPVVGSAWRDMWKLAEGREPPQEEAWGCLLGFESGAVGTLQLSCLDRLNERVAVTGRQASVTVDGWRSVVARLPGQEAPEVWEPNDQLPGDAVDPRHVHGFAGEIRHFVECAATGRRPEVTIDDGIEAVRLELALKRAANERRVVEVREV
jgi:myo-inositol 2-dehydrogenase/D-chiro-inositol 1-dehydrogenase